MLQLDCYEYQKYEKNQGRRERDALIDEMECEWNCAVQSAIPEDLWPRRFDKSSGLELPKRPKDWSQEMLRALRDVSIVTVGNPRRATEVLREAVEQQVARYGDTPFLCKEDVRHAMHLLQGGFESSHVHQARQTRSPHEVPTVRTSEMSLRDRGEPVDHPMVTNSAQSIPLVTRGSSAMTVTPLPPPVDNDVQMDSSAKPEASLLELLSARSKETHTSLPGSPQQAPQQPLSPTGEHQSSRPGGLTMPQKQLIEEYKIARLRRDLLASGVDPDSI